MNGLYFKVSNVYGLPIYKMVKLQDSQPVQRFLWREKRRGFWVVDTKPNTFSKSPGCAFVHSEAEEPSMIEKVWYVWYGETSDMREYGEKKTIVTEGGQHEDVIMNID